MATQTFSVDRVVAGAYFEVTKRYFAADVDPPPSLILKGLVQNEIRYFMSCLAQSELGAVTVVVASDTGHLSTREHSTSHDRSVHHYLNTCENGLIYFASIEEIVDPPPGNALLLCHTKLFNKSSDQYGSFVGDLIRLTIDAVSLESLHVPARIQDQIKLILDLSDPKSVSLRAFIRFCYATVLDIFKSGSSCTGSDMDGMAGRYLSELGYFPDEQWRADPSIDAIKERLAMNLCHVGLVDMFGNDVKKTELIERCRARIFKTPSGDYYPDMDQMRWRGLIERYCLDQSMDVRKLIPFHVFRQLFTNYRSNILATDQQVHQADDSSDLNLNRIEVDIQDDSSFPVSETPDPLPSDTPPANMSDEQLEVSEADIQPGKNSPSDSIDIQEYELDQASLLFPDPDLMEPDPIESINSTDRSPPAGLNIKAMDIEESQSNRNGSLSLENLTDRYQLILDTYEEFGVSVLSTELPGDSFVEGPASVLYRVRPGSGVDTKKIIGKADALKLALELEASQNIRFEIDRGFVTIDVPKVEQDRYFISAQELWAKWTFSRDMLSVPLGLDNLGNVVSIDFSSSNSPHLLIAGTTGSGKSEALNTILGGLVNHYNPEQLKLLLVDPKGTELGDYDGSPFLEEAIGWDEEDAIDLLTHAVNEMQNRYLRFKEVGKRSLRDYNAAVRSPRRFPWWLLVLDEYADLTSDGEVKKSIEGLLRRLAQKARAAGIHVIIATQKPSVDVINSTLRSNLPAQLALRVKSQTESRVIMDDIGAEALNGKGDAFLKCEGRMTRIQCAKT